MQLMKGLIFNFLIGGTDAHAKNFSIMHLAGGISVFAPLYDLISFDPYMQNEKDLPHLKMAMKVGHYEFDKVMPRHWEKLAGDFQIEAEQVIETLKSFSSEISDHMASIRNQCHNHGLMDPILDKMVDAMAARCQRVQRVYGTAFNSI